MSSFRSLMRGFGLVVAAGSVAWVTFALMQGAPITGEFLVSGSNATQQILPGVARDADGDSVVVWSGAGTGDDRGIFMQRYNANGAAQGGIVRVNGTVAGIQQRPVVARAATGGFVVVWESQEAGSDPARFDIFAHAYDADGVSIGGEFRVNTTTANDQTLPAIGMNAAGAYVIAWSSLGQDGSGEGVYAQYFEADGDRRGIEFRANTFTTNSQSTPAVALDDLGAFVIVWESNSQENVGVVDNVYGIYGQRYDQNVIAQGAEFHVNTTIAGEQRFPSVASGADGAFVVVWQSSPDVGVGADYQIVSRRYGVDGLPLDGEVVVNNQPPLLNFTHERPSVVMDRSGGFAVSWHGGDPDGMGSRLDIKLRRYDSAGLALDADEVSVNTAAAHEQSLPRVATDADGDLLVVWQSDPANNFTQDIFGRRYVGYAEVDLSVDVSENPDPVPNPQNPQSPPPDLVGDILNPPPPPPPPPPAPTVRYTVTVSNLQAQADAGVGTATGVRSEFTKPADGFTFVGVEATGWDCVNNPPGSPNKVVCTLLQPLPAGAAASYVVSMTAPQPTNTTNLQVPSQATVSADQFDPVMDNNTALEETAVCGEAVDPASSLRFSSASYTVGEDAGNAVITVTRTGGACGTARVKVSTQQTGKALAGVDYTSVSQELVFAVGGPANQTVNVPIQPDDLDEIDEPLSLVLSAADRATLANPSTATLTIADKDDPPFADFNIEARTSEERDEETFSIMVKLDDVSGRDVVIPYTRGGTATLGTDYDLTPNATPLTIPEGQTEFEFTLTIKDDPNFETDETVVLDVGNPNASASYRRGAVGSYTHKINDNDEFPQVRFELADSEFPEAGLLGQTETQIKVVMSRPTIGDVNVEFAVEGLTASMADFNSLTFNCQSQSEVTPRMCTDTLTIVSGDTFATIGVTINDDLIDERAREQIQLSLIRATNASVFSPAAGTHLLSIVDDDIATVAFTVEQQSVGEAAGMVMVKVVRTGATDYRFTVPFTVSGTAVNPADHNAVNGRFEFRMNAENLQPVLEKTYQFTVEDDAIDEFDETVIVTLGQPAAVALTPWGEAVLTEPDVQTVTIVDNDDPVVTLAIDAPMFAEDDAGEVVITATLDAPAVEAAVINLAYAGTATQDVDYSGAMTSVTIPVGMTEAVVTLKAIDDLLDEANEETVQVSILPTSQKVRLGAIVMVEVDLIDNDIPEVFFEVAAQNVAEGAGQVTVNVTRMGGTTFDVTVPVTVAGTATAADHTAVNGNVLIPASAGTATVAYTFNVTQDLVDEANETVILSLGAAVGGSAVTAAPDVHTVTILDDDVTTVAFETAMQEKDEGTMVTVKVIRTGATDFPITAEVNVGLGTATLADHNAVDEVVNIPASGAALAEAVYEFMITEDVLDENNETVVLNLENPLGGDVSLGMPFIHTVTITDNDALPTLNIANPAAVLEPAGADDMVELTFDVMLNVVSGRDVSFDYTIADVTAKHGADYSGALTGTVTIDAGDQVGQITVMVNGDMLDEAAETLTATISNPLNAVLGTSVATGTINDDAADVAPTVSIGPAVMLDEGNLGATTPFNFNVSLAAPSGQEITVQYSTGAPATATAGTDYTAVVNQVITFAPGETMKTATVNVIGDNLNELNETFTVTIANPVNAMLGTATALGTIVNDDPLPKFSIADAMLTETNAGQNLSFTVTLDAPSGRTTRFNYQTMDDSALSPADYTAVPSTLVTVPAGQTSAMFNIAIAGDVLNEADETFTVQLSLPGNANAELLDGEATGTIVNDDPLPKFSIADAMIAEGDAGAQNLAFTITLDAPSGRATSVNVSTLDDTAVAGADYTAVNQTVDFAAGVTSVMVNVPVLGDLLDENDETFKVNLSSVVDAEILDGEAIGTITDNDNAPTVTLSINQASIAEAAGVATLTATLDAVSGLPVTVNLSYADTAMRGIDYAAADSIMIPAGQLSAGISVTATQDAVDEADEGITASILNAVNATPAGVAVMTTIADDDATTVAFSATMQSVGEGVGQVTVNITRTGATTFPITVPVTVGAGTATAGGTDHNAVSANVVIPASPLATDSGSYTFMVNNDLLDEADETVVLNLGLPTGGDVMAIAPTTHTVTITDNDDPPTVTLTAENGPLAEAGGVGQLRATLDAVSGLDVTVNLSYSGEAVLDTDYEADLSIVVPAGQMSMAINVTATQDLIDENNETLTAAIDTVINGTELNIQTASLTITDDDAPPSVSLSIDPASIVEAAGVATLTATLDAASGLPVTVNLSYAGTALRGTDYAAAGSITIPASQMFASIPVTATQDAIDEANEGISISILDAVNATPAGMAAVTSITDDDATTVAFTSAMQTVDEGVGMVTVSLTRTGATTFDITIPVSLGTGTSTAADHNAAAANVTIPASLATSAAGTYTFVVTEDLLDENNETVVLNLGVPTGGDVTAIAPTTHTVTITDNDALPALSVADVTVTEPLNQGDTVPMVFNVSLAPVSGRSVSVDYTLAGVTAVRNKDFTVASLTGTLSFAAGETLKTVTVLVNGDMLDEASETLTLTLSNVVNATLPGAAATGTILDNADDVAPSVALSINPAAISENGGVATLTATPNVPSGLPITVMLNYGGDAVRGADYSGADSIVIPAEATSAAITLTAINDTLDEANESVTVSIASATNATPVGAAVLTSIVDDDLPPTVSFDPVAQTVSEGNSGTTAVTVTARLSTLSGQSVSVPFIVTGTAVNPADHTAVNGVITIPANSLTGTASFNVVGDALDEANETVIFTLGTPTNATAAASPANVHTVTIVDDDLTPSVRFSAATQTVAEGDSGSTARTAVVQLSAPSSFDVTVSYTVSGTATAGSDYIASNGSLSIPAGSTTASLNFAVVGDTIDEDNETVVFTLSSPVNALLGTPVVHTVTIVDDENASTLEDTQGREVTVTADRGQITRLESVAAPSGATLPAGFTYQNGFFAIDITGTTPGFTSVVTIELPAGSNPTGYLKCNASGCAQFPGAIISGNFITLTLVDGGAGDTDGANGVIRDPGAPMYSALQSLQPKSGGSLGAGLLALLVAALGLRRRYALAA